MNPNSPQKRMAFGYNRDYGKIVINKGQAAAVKLIFMYYLEGKSLGEIKDILEGMNIPSPQNRPTWGKQLLSNILSNAHYLGSDIYPPIITQEDFDKVQKIDRSAVSSGNYITYPAEKQLFSRKRTMRKHLFFAAPSLQK